jgi:ribulose kinase
VSAADIDVVSFSGQMMGAVLLDSSGAPIRPVIICADTRSTTQCAHLVDSIGMEQGYAITGHRPNPTYSLSKIMWVRDHEPEVFDATTVVVQAKDFMVFRLTGRIMGVGRRSSAVARPADAQYDLQSRHCRPICAHRHHAGRRSVVGVDHRHARPRGA